LALALLYLSRSIHRLLRRDGSGLRRRRCGGDREKRMNQHLTAVAAAVAAVTLLAAGCSKSKALAPPPPPPTVLVSQVEQRDVPVVVEAVGALDGYANVDIRARVRGFLLEQRYLDGADVREGQLLFTIDPAEYEAALAAARASLSRAQAAQAHHRALRERKRALAPSGVVSQQELEDADAQVRDADGQVEAARAQVRQAELNLSYTRIRSPLSGLAGVALVRPGNLVGQDGPTLLTTVSQVDPIRVTFPLGEVDYVRAPGWLKRISGRDLGWARQQLQRLEQGGSAEGGDPGVELVLSDGKPYPHRGVVVAANRQIDPSTGTIQLQALFPNPARDLRPGQYGRVRLRSRDQGSGALVVPERSLLQMQGTYSVAVVGPENKVQLRRVEVGPASGSLRIVTAGLSTGERVVAEGVQKVSEGTLVNPQPAPEFVSAPAAPGR
jgi:membrane fusion protein, multidrug efflux system